MYRALRCLTLVLLLFVTAGLGDSGTADLLLLASPAYPGQMRLGSAGFVLPGGPVALEGNPARLGAGFTAAGGKWNLETTSVSTGGVFSTSSSITAGAGVRYLGRGNLTERNEQGEETGVFSFSSGLVSAGISFDLAAGYRAGVALGTAWEKIGSDTGSGFFASIGLSGSPLEGLETGAVLRNTGQAPSWNNIHKDMPTEVVLGARYRVFSAFSVFSGGRIGFSTHSSVCAGIELDHGGFQVSGGWEITPDEDEISGAFGGIGYAFVSEEIYLLELAVSQRDELTWPVLAGLSVLF